MTGDRESQPSPTGRPALRCSKAVIAAGILVLCVWCVWYWSRTTGPTRRAASPDPAVRAKAAAELAAELTPAQATTLRKLAADPETTVSVTAILGLHPLNDLGADAENQNLLKQLMAGTGDPEMRAVAAAQLGVFPQTDPADLSVRLLDANEDPRVRAGAALGLGRLKNGAGIPALFRALHDPSPLVRARAISAISAMCISHFAFDASKPPEQQQEEIRFIEEFLRQRHQL